MTTDVFLSVFYIFLLLHICNYIWSVWLTRSLTVCNSIDNMTWHEPTAQCYSSHLAYSQSYPSHVPYACVCNTSKMEVPKRGNPKSPWMGMFIPKVNLKMINIFGSVQTLCATHLTLKCEVVMSTMAHTHAPDSVGVHVSSLFIISHWDDNRNSISLPGLFTVTPIIKHFYDISTFIQNICWPFVHSSFCLLHLQLQIVNLPNVMHWF